jgi:tetratricopeptide (TPR) repeat protein
METPGFSPESFIFQMKTGLVISLAGILLLLPAVSFAQNEDKDVKPLFYEANILYKKGDYAGAVERYAAMVDKGFENGSIYYNLGNGYLKLGKLGYAILAYEKARTFMPADSDLRANLNYAKSMMGDGGVEAPPENFVALYIKLPFNSLSLNTVTALLVILYAVVMFLLTAMILNPVFARKAALPFAVLAASFLIILTAFGIRYYDEEILKHGIVVQKEVECKYEPIDRATTYYKLREGNDVLILKTWGDWRQIKRLDGKIAWVRKEAVEKV